MLVKRRVVVYYSMTSMNYAHVCPSDSDSFQIRDTRLVAMLGVRAVALAWQRKSSRDLVDRMSTAHDTEP